MKHIQYFTLRAANAFKFVPTNLVGKYGRFNPVVNGYQKLKHETTTKDVVHRRENRIESNFKESVH